MSKQTAVQQAINRIKELQNSINSSSQQIALAQAMDILEKYKEIEKQNAVQFAIDWWGDDSDLSAKEYYNETFNK
jgi:hypothetical protein